MSFKRQIAGQKTIVTVTAHRVNTLKEEEKVLEESARKRSRHIEERICACARDLGKTMTNSQYRPTLWPGLKPERRSVVTV
jgi:hypothetical protein